MNMSLMEKETTSLIDVVPTKFVKAYCEFWAGAYHAFCNHLPDSHKKTIDENLSDFVSIESVDAFKRCFNGGYIPKVAVYDR